MDRLKSVLNGFIDLSVLDVATGTGAFLDQIMQFVPTHCQSRGTGIDIKAEAIQAAKQRFEQMNYHFDVMDCHQLNYPNACFDLVSISNSLHHFENPERVLSEMIRVLKPNGLFVLFEMVSDQQNDKQQTHVELHHYWASIDRRLGTFHNETFSRSDLRDLFNPYPKLTIKQQWEIEDDAPPCTEEDYEMLKNTVTSYLEKAKTFQDYEAFNECAATLLQRIDQIGFESATECLWIFEKTDL